jgi:hypothetical protein
MGCPCRNCIFSGIYGGEAAKPGFLCPNNKRLSVKAFEDIKGLLSSLGALIENVSISAGIVIKGSHSLFDSREENRPGSECPMERVDEKTAMRGSDPGIGGKVEEYGG